MSKKQTKRLNGNKITAPSITGRFELTLLCGDAHSYDCDMTVVDAMMKQAKAIKHKHRLFGGDLYNLDAFRTGASDGDKMHSVSEDMNCAEVVIGEIQPDIVLDGNHEWRYYNLLRSGWAVDQEAGKRIKEHYESITSGTLRYPYHKRNGICRIGDTGVQHGGYFGSLERTLDTYGKSVAFHYHRFMTAVRGGIPNPKRLQTIGCLAHTDMRYNEKDASSLLQEQGWGWLLHDTWSGECLTIPVQRIGDAWTPINFKL